jgi:hypothetical protein
MRNETACISARFAGSDSQNYVELLYTTAEIVLTTLPGLVFARSPDPVTGYRELAIAVECEGG